MSDVSNVSAPPKTPPYLLAAKRPVLDFLGTVLKMVFHPASWNLAMSLLLMLVGWNLFRSHYSLCLNAWGLCFFLLGCRATFGAIKRMIHDWRDGWR